LKGRQQLSWRFHAGADAFWVCGVGNILKACFPGIFTGVIPRMVAHDPPQRPSAQSLHVLASATGIRTYDLVMDLIESSDVWPGTSIPGSILARGSTPADRMFRLGALPDSQDLARTHGVTPAILSREATILLQDYLTTRARMLRLDARSNWRTFLVLSIPWTEYALYYTFLEHHHITTGSTSI
jgi:Family of unknown function (DUF6492)